MKLSRRAWLQLSAGLSASGGATTLLAGCSQLVRRATAPKLAPVALPPGDADPTVRLLNRVAFGPAPGDVARVRELGTSKYIDEQLNPDGGEDTTLALRLHSVEVFEADAMDLRDLRIEPILRQLQQAALLRAVYSRHQLRERLVDFWSNHFNIYARKGNGIYFVPRDQVQVIRQHALGQFPAMLKASATSPAMLQYLDNQVNRRGVPNENYARELMELHTLGVHGGYTQKDVQEVARCLTGWTVEDRFLRRKGTFRFDPDRHDDGPKTVLGHKIPAKQGEKDAAQVLDILARHPATARFISAKLCRYFLGDNTGDWPAKMAATYLATGGDIKAMLRPLLLSDDLLHAAPILKRPFDFVVSTLRALSADTDGGAGVQEHLARMGQPLYQWPMPDGYPDATAAWTGSLLARWNFAFALTGGSVQGTTVNLKALLGEPPTADALLELVLSRHLSGALHPLRDRLAAHLKKGKLPHATALLLSAPEFQWR